MNWERIDEIISEVDKPITLLLTIILNHKNIKNKNLNFVFRLYIKYHYMTLLNFPVVKLFTSMKININPSIMKFYKFYFKLSNSFNSIIKFKNKFNKYKSLNMIEFEKKVESDIKVFSSYFDASHSNNNFHSKLMQYFCSDKINPTIENEVKKRLSQSLSFLGLKFVTYFKIPILSMNEFNYLKGIEKFKFINNYYNKTLKSLQTVNLNIKKINIYKNILVNLSKPKNIKVTIINNLNSETENEDVKIFS